MAGQEKAGSRSSDLSVESEELAGATTFVSSVEGEPVLMVEGIGISATTFAATSNLGFGVPFEGAASDDGETQPANVFSEDDGVHVSDIVPPVMGKAVGDVESNVANAGPDTDGEIMCNEKIIQPIQVGRMGNQNHSEDVMHTTNDSARVDGRVSVNDRLLVQTEYPHHESLSSESETHGNEEATSEANPTTVVKLPEGAEITTRNGVLAVADDNRHKETSVDGDFVQFTGDREDCQPGVVVDGMPFADAVVKDEERIFSKAGAGVVETAHVDSAYMSSAAVAKKAFVDTMSLVDDKRCSDTIFCPVSEMRPSPDPANVVSESPVVPMDGDKECSDAILSPVSEMRPSSDPASVINENPAIPIIDDQVYTDAIVSPVSETRLSSDPASVVNESQVVPVIDDKGCSNAILSSVPETRPSCDPASVINGSSAGDAGPISQEETSTDGLPNAQATSTTDDGSMLGGRASGHVVQALSVDVAEVVTEKVFGDVGTIVQDKPSASAMLSTDIGTSANAGILLEEKTADFESSKDGKSSSATGHMFEIDAVANVGLNRDPICFTDIVLSNNLNLSAKSQGPVDAVHCIEPLDSNINVTSTDTLPSMEPASSTGAVTDGGLGLYSQKEDAVQTHVYCGGGKTLVGQKVKKRFGRKKYTGEVVGFDPETYWYKVTYEDGDEEDLEWDELDPILLQSDGENLAIRKRKRRSRSHVGESRRSFKRVRRPEGPRVSRGRGRAISNSDMCQSGERNHRKEDDKDEHDDEDFSMTDSADRLSSPMRTTRRRHPEEMHGILKRRKVETGDSSEKEQTIGLRTRSRLMTEAKDHGQSDSIEGKVSTRRSSVSSASNPEGISGSHINVEKPIPDFHDSAKSESLESSEKNAPPQGGGVILIGRKTRKDFGGQYYEGEVVSYDFKAKYYKVKYEDGDEEELEWSELEPTLVPSDQKPLSFKSMLRARNLAATRQPQKTKIKDQFASIKDHTAKVKQALGLYEVGPPLSEQQKHARHILRMEINGQAASASVLEEGNEDLHWKEDSSGADLVPMGSFGLMRSPPRPLAAARFASAGDADIYEYFSWGEVTGFDKAKCPELRAAKLLPTASPIVHLAASQHHLAAITATGQVWLWRNKHGNIHTRCNEWEHLAFLEEKEIVLVDIGGPDLDRVSGGYEADQEDQVPDPFYLVAVGASGEDFILQGSQPQEPVRTYQFKDEPQYLGLKGVLSQFDHSSLDGVGKIVQVSVGTVEAPDESPFIGYITDNDHVYIRSATRDYMEEVNLVTGYTGKPIKIQCGRVYHAIIMTDDGRAWTWGRGYYPGLNSSSSSGFPAATCQPAVGTLVGRKVIDVGCYGEDFIALTSDGDVHQWSHAVPNPAAGVYNVPATPLYGQGPCIPHGDKLRQVSIGAGMCSGITDGGKVHTWRTAMKGGLVGILVPEKEALTPLGHEESHRDTAIVSLGHRTATKVMCVAGSLIVVVKKKVRGRMGSRRKPEKDSTESGMGGHGFGH